MPLGRQAQEKKTNNIFSFSIKPAAYALTFVRIASEVSMQQALGV